MAKAKQKTKFKRHHEVPREALSAQDQATKDQLGPELPEGIVAVDLEDPEAAHNAIAEAVGEPIVGPNVTTGDFDDKSVEDEPEKTNNSVVAAKFKNRYIAHAREAGIKGKAARRSNWDWLAQEIAKFCLVEKQKIDINKFLTILEANGVDHSKWNNRARGWEGRLRMTGRVALQRIVADSGSLKIGDEVLTPPADFVEKYKTKD